jgi:hypothetical protein
MGYIYNNAYINVRKVWNRKSKKENIMAKTKTTKIQTYKQRSTQYYTKRKLKLGQHKLHYKPRC